MSTGHILCKMRTMLILLSPSKTQDRESLSPTELYTEPLFEEERWHLVRKLKELSKRDIMKVMKISEQLAEKHILRTGLWSKRHTKKKSKQAIHLFTGAVYDSFKNNSFTAREYAYMQKNLRILSGMYGVIRPLDLIQPYRLEMGTKFSFVLKKQEYKNLYMYWSDVVTSHFCNNKDRVVINLASEEYSKVIVRETCPLKFLEVQFLEKKGSEYKQVTIYTKKARGSLACWIVKKGCRTVEDIKEYKELGYVFSKRKSNEKKFVFIRKSSVSYTHLTLPTTPYV